MNDLKDIRRRVVAGEYFHSKYGGTTLHLDLICGHRKTVSRPPSKVPKTCICIDCSNFARAGLLKPRLNSR